MSDRMVSNWEGRHAVPGREFQAVLDAALDLASAQSRTRFVSWPSRVGHHTPDDAPRWVVHVVANVTEQDDARDVAEQAAVLLGPIREIDPGEMAISREDRQLHRARVFCDRRLGEGRCTHRAGHDNRCEDRGYSGL